MEYLKRYEFKTNTRYEVIELTNEIKNYVESSGVKSGLCVVHSPSVTSGLTIYSFPDPKGFDDFEDELDKIVPTRIDFKHQHDTPSDAAAHVKSAMIGTTLTLIISEGKLLLGHSQGIIYAEFDGPRSRDYYIKIYPDITNSKS